RPAARRNWARPSYTASDSTSSTGTHTSAPVTNGRKLRASSATDLPTRNGRPPSGRTSAFSNKTSFTPARAWTYTSLPANSPPAFGGGFGSSARSTSPPTTTTTAAATHVFVTMSHLPAQSSPGGGGRVKHRPLVVSCAEPCSK